MPTRSRTLRRLPTFTRKYYRLTDELESVLNRLKNLREDVQRMELDARALFERQAHEAAKEPDDMPDVLSFESTGIKRP